MKVITSISFIVAVGAAALAADNARTSDYDYDAPVPGSYTLPVIKPAADGALLDSAGKAVRLSELTRGRVFCHPPSHIDLMDGSQTTST